MQEIKILGIFMSKIVFIMVFVTVVCMYKRFSTQQSNSTWFHLFDIVRKANDVYDLHLYMLLKKKYI